MSLLEGMRLPRTSQGTGKQECPRSAQVPDGSVRSVYIRTARCPAPGSLPLNRGTAVGLCESPCSLPSRPFSLSFHVASFCSAVNLASASGLRHCEGGVETPGPGSAEPLADGEEHQPREAALLRGLLTAASETPESGICSCFV